MCMWSIVGAYRCFPWRQRSLAKEVTLCLVRKPSAKTGCMKNYIHQRLHPYDTDTAHQRTESSWPIMTSLKRSYATDTSAQNLSSKVYIRSTKSGKVQKIVRELYLRQDIPCSSRLCSACLSIAPTDYHNKGRFPTVSRTRDMTQQKAVV